MTLQETIVTAMSSSHDYRTTLETILKHPEVTHKQQVSFAYSCAIDAPKVTDETTEEKRMKCLQLVAAWLEDASKVTEKQLTDAARAASSYAVYVAAYAAYTAAAAYAANAAEYAAEYATYAAEYAAAYAAEDAANAASRTAYAVAYAAEDAAAYNTKMQHYLKQLIKHLSRNNKLLEIVM